MYRVIVLRKVSKNKRKTIDIKYMLHQRIVKTRVSKTEHFISIIFILLYAYC